MTARSLLRPIRLSKKKKYDVLGATQNCSVDIRLVAATHRNLKQLSFRGLI
ncbi:MAG: sigma 54-interacting transcriptional regulator [Moraxellaceae bacterium]|nr:sigma 54-interacting transcriptional regulator [Moraxellaceae bacterium]